MFTYSVGLVFLCVLVYVDALIITGNDLSALQKCKAHLSTYFYMKDLVPLKYFLGINVAQSEKGIYICKQKYAMEILSYAGLLGTKSLTFHMEQNH